MTFRSMLRRPSAFLPLAMSAAALVFLLGYVAMFGVVRSADEGTPAHLFQLLMVAQLPVIAAFALSWLPKAPRQAALILGLQFIAAVVPVATVLALEM